MENDDLFRTLYVVYLIWVLWRMGVLAFTAGPSAAFSYGWPHAILGVLLMVVYTIIYGPITEPIRWLQ